MMTEKISCDEISTPITRIGLGTWAMGGAMWGGTDDLESMETIQHAVDAGITLIDTAPVYGYGRSEEVVGKALALSQYLSAADLLAQHAQANYGKGLLAFAVRWILDRRETMADLLWHAKPIAAGPSRGSIWMEFSGKPFETLSVPSLWPLPFASCSKSVTGLAALQRILA